MKIKVDKKLPEILPDYSQRKSACANLLQCCYAVRYQKNLGGGIITVRLNCEFLFSSPLNK